VTNGNSQKFEFQIGNRTFTIQFDNHFDLLRYLLSASRECLLVSPFLYRDFRPLFAGLRIDDLQVELISTCAPRGSDQLEKPFALRSFGAEIQSATGTWPTIGLDQTLHSKVYIFSTDGTPFAGIVTSANLTHTGLSRNHETGVLFTSEAKLVKLARAVRSNLDYVSLSEYQIEKLCVAAELIGRETKPSVDLEIGLTRLLNLYGIPSAGNRSIKLREQAHYYIKVSGVRDRPILPEDRKPFNEPHCPLSFAKNPGSINLGDCLLDVAVGGKCFLSYYSCASAVYERTDKEKRTDPDYKRWPYYVYANNLSLHYGAVWFEEPIYYDDVVNAFKASHPDTPVTSAGSDHFLGAMQMGHSYISVTKEFGDYVRQRIDSFRADQHL